jgi:hypothetical protein
VLAHDEAVSRVRRVAVNLFALEFQQSKVVRKRCKIMDLQSFAAHARVDTCAPYLIVARQRSQCVPERLAPLTERCGDNLREHTLIRQTQTRFA